METLTRIDYSGRYGHILTEITEPQHILFSMLSTFLLIHSCIREIPGYKQDKGNQADNACTADAPFCFLDC
jgi:hypothetical protein